MIKRFFKGLFVSVIVVLAIAVAGYVYIAYHYGETFSYGTVINGKDCTGKTIEEINEELISDLIYYEGLTILDKDGKSYSLSAADVNLSYDFLTPLYDFYFSQNSLLWGLNLLPSNQQTLIKPLICYNSEQLDILVDALPIWEKEIPDSERQVKIVDGPEGLYLLNQREDILRPVIAKEKIYLFFDSLIPVLNLKEEGCYENLNLDDSMMETVSIYEKIKQFDDCGITYKFGDDLIPVTRKDADGFIKYDENGNVKSIGTDTARLNTVSNAVNRNVDKRISEMKSIPVSIPVSSIFGDEIVSGLGPKLTFYVTMTGSASTKFQNVFDSTGVNQTRHQIMLNISVDVYVIFGRKIEKYKSESNVCIAESIIVGNTPSALAQMTK